MKGKQVICCFALLVLLALQNGNAYGGTGFVKPSGTHFVIDGQPFYSNGFNAYWLMYMASDPNDRAKVSPTLQQAASLGLKVIRTWAFNDGGSRALQESPGQYNEATFQVHMPSRVIVFKWSQWKLINFQVNRQQLNIYTCSLPKTKRTFLQIHKM